MHDAVTIGHNVFTPPKFLHTGSPVGQTTLNAKAGKFVSVSSGENVVTLELSIDDLADDVSVGETDDKSVLGGVVLVLGLNNQALASIVVSLSLCR
jgi:hypothetical protein